MENFVVPKQESLQIYQKEQMSVKEKLKILSDAAKYDVSCSSSGVGRKGDGTGIGNTESAGICHSFSSDGRCISLLKILQTNECVYDCKYCQNRMSNDVKRAGFTPEEIAELTISFYRRNYIEGLFLSSAVLGTPDRTMELMIEALCILREEYHFNGYIHAKTIPDADPMLVEKIGRLADRLSVNIELPSETSLTTLAPDKKKTAILRPMGQIAVQSAQSKKEMVLYRGAKPFAPAGQSTQMIIGATPETDRHIMDLTEGLYRKYSLKRVFYSAYLPVVEDRRLPALHTAPPLLREHRLYQADWLLRYYHFSARELLTEDEPNFDPYLDPKCTWAVRHPEFFPVEVNTASRAELLRVPGIGPKSALRIVAWQSSSASESCLSGHSISLPARARQRPAAAARRSRGRCLTPRRSAWGCSSFRWTILYPRPCQTLPRLCKGWRRAAWRRTWPPGRCGRRHCNVLRSACDRHSLLL